MGKRGDYHHGDLRSAVLELAREQIGLHGVEGFSLRAVAREIGVSATAVYRHFADREAVVAELARQGHEQMGQLMQAAVAQVPAGPAARVAVARLYAVGLGYLRFARADPHRFRLMFARRLDAYPPVGPGPLLHEALDGLVRAGVIPARRRRGAEVPVWASVHGLATLVVDGLQPAADDTALEALYRRTAEFVFDALGVPRQARRGP